MVHVRDRLWIPPPQDSLQESQLCQLDHAPSRSIFFKYHSYNQGLSICYNLNVYVTRFLLIYHGNCFKCNIQDIIYYIILFKILSDFNQFTDIMDIIEEICLFSVRSKNICEILVNARCNTFRSEKYYSWCWGVKNNLIFQIFCLFHALFKK